MTNSNDGAYAPGIYVKGDVARVAKTASQAVAFVFDGFKPQKVESPVETAETPSDEAPESVATSDNTTPPAAPKPQAPKPKDVVKP